MTSMEKITATALIVMTCFIVIATAGLLNALLQASADRARDDLLVRQCIGQGLPEIACIGVVRGVSQ